MKITKKQVIIALVTIIVIATVALGTLFAINKMNNDKVVIVTQESADTLKNQAIDALENEDETMAKTLFEKAKQEYKDLGDTNNVVDTEAQLFLLNKK